MPLLFVGLLGLLILAAARSKPTVAPSSSGCSPQDPQAFLIRSNYIHDANAAKAAIDYRTAQYGYVQGFGDASLNPYPPSHYAVATTFFGLPVTLHAKIVPWLQCVEAELRATCGSSYQPKHLSGLRVKNTFHGGSEVSNHLYGIAIDIDPSDNPCCGCVPPWNDNPRCKQPSSSEYDRMAMPECWVHVFEKYGFYWLGHDPDLRDQMHFEFLGVP